MSRVKQIAMAAGTFGVALGVGFVMQNGDALASRFGGDETVAPAAPEVQPAVQTASMVPGASETQEIPVSVEIADLADSTEVGPTMSAPEAEPALSAVALPEEALAPEAEQAPLELAAVEADETPNIMSDASTEPVMAQDCAISMTSATAPAAFVDIDIDAPCHANSPFVVHHQGMMFTTMTDDSGHADVEVPALAEVAVFIAAFPDGEGNVTTSTVPDFANYDRAVLQWEGETAVMLSAYEFGAGFGEDGHVFRDNARSSDDAVDGDGGFLVTLGDYSVEDALMAEVYTFPSGTIGSDGEILLSAEAEITTENCGKELAAQSIQVFPDGNTMALDLTMVMPECDAVGDFLILQNMFEDLTLASR